MVPHVLPVLEDFLDPVREDFLDPAHAGRLVLAVVREFMEREIVFPLPHHFVAVDNERYDMVQPSHILLVFSFLLVVKNKGKLCKGNKFLSRIQL